MKVKLDVVIEIVEVIILHPLATESDTLLLFTHTCTLKPITVVEHTEVCLYFSKRTDHCAISGHHANQVTKLIRSLSS